MSTPADIRSAIDAALLAQQIDVALEIARDAHFCMICEQVAELWNRACYLSLTTHHRPGGTVEILVAFVACNMCVNGHKTITRTVNSRLAYTIQPIEEQRYGSQYRD